ncbi:MAG: hypothetical protein GXY34_02180 [Syntrophomonadaceae bacterium]|nr:hypothetical protein [Syntrophomonadaceae bacterium]
MPHTGKSIAHIISLLIASIFVCLIFVSLALARRDANIYPSNVWAGGVAIGDLTPDQAAKALAAKSSATDIIRLKLPDKTLRIPLKDIGVQYNNALTLAQVNKNLFPDGGLAGLLRHSIVRGKRQEIAPIFACDTQVLQRQIRAIKVKHDKPATDARIIYSNNYWEYVSHSSGYAVNTANSVKKIDEALKRGSLNNLALAVKPTSPRVKLDDISRIDGIIGRSEIDLPGSHDQYTSTLKHINGMIILPGGHIDLAMTGSGYSGLIIGALSSACFQAGMQSQGRYIYNRLGHPILISATSSNNYLTIRIYSCQGSST